MNDEIRPYGGKRIEVKVDKELLIDVLETAIDNAGECQQKYLDVKYPSQKRHFDMYQADIKKAEKLLEEIG